MKKYTACKNVGIHVIIRGQNPNKWEEIMKKIFRCIGVMTLLGAFLTGCSMGPEQVKSVPIEDEARVQTLHDATKDAIKTYFDVDVNDGVERKIEGFESYVLVDLPSETYEHRNNVFRATLEGEPEEGQVFSYGASLNPETNELTGAIVIQYSDAEPKEYTIDAQKEIAMNFIKENNLVENPDELVFEGTEKSISNTHFSGLRFTDNEKTLVMSISLQAGEITSFEFVEPIQAAEEAK